MKREEYIKQLISQKGYNIKSFAASIGMPYSTLLTMLNGSIGGASVDNVIKICKGLQITINDLQQYASGEKETSDVVTLTDRELRVILAYRQNPAMQSAVDKLLNISDDDAGGDISEDMTRQAALSISRTVDTK